MTGTSDAVLHSAPGALVLEHVTRRYPGNPDPSVDDLSLTIAPGELLALVGASGSGKTTTLRIAAGYETPDSGRVLLGDGAAAPRDITRESPQRRGFGMVFQHYALFPHMRVEENVAFGLEARGVRKADRLARAREALDAVGLSGKAERSVQALSGGEQQRVALARALVIQPRVLLLDEPLSNLDPTLRQSMRDELRFTLRQSGVTALFVTHDQEDAFAVADRVAMLERGKLLQVGTPETLYHAPATRAVAEFVGRAALVPAERMGERVRITIDGVALDARARHEGVVGGSALFAVLRPESLVLSETDDVPSWRGVVVGRRFAGGHVVYRVTLGNGAEVEVMGDGAGAREGTRTGVRLADVPVAVVPA
ncbi:MAG: ABC transporter ATP-binding protein [Gemmatimonadaceae bacterium]|nr:ABC transporter ATP-binding protein [Gemmatimonadaceae bacterium]